MTRRDDTQREIGRKGEMERRKEGVVEGIGRRGVYWGGKERDMEIE